MHDHWVKSKAYTTREAAERLGVDDSTLRRWRSSRPPQGPAFVQVSPRNYRYYESDLEAFLDSKRHDQSRATP